MSPREPSFGKTRAVPTTEQSVERNDGGRSMEMRVMDNDNDESSVSSWFVDNNDGTQHSHRPQNSKNHDDVKTDSQSDDNNEINEVLQTTKSETKSIRIWRALVVVFILLAGAVVSWGTYHFISQQLVHETEVKYHAFAEKIEDASLSHVGDLLNAIKSLSSIITSQVSEMNKEQSAFPFVTIENWETYGHQARQQGAIEVVSFCTWLKTEEQIQAFPAYAAQYNEAWQQESVAIHKKLNPRVRNTTFPISELAPFVYNIADPTNPSTEGIYPSTGPDPVLPIWMQSPPSQNLGSGILGNIYVYWKEHIDVVLSTKKMHLGPMNTQAASQVDLIVGSQAHIDYHTTLHSDETLGIIKPSEQAHGVFFAPVATRLDPSAGVEVGGILAGLFGFDAFLVNILPNGIRGINVVIRNSCNDAYTYELHGNEATFVGQGDLSDPTYSYLKREIDVDEHFGLNDPDPNTAGSCSYVFQVTPTSLYIQDNASNSALIVSFVIASIFILTGMTFITYDTQVQRRNQIMVHSAARSHKVVASMFPYTVRDRLLDADEFKSGTEVLSSLQPTKSQLKRYLLTQTVAAYGKVIVQDTVLTSKPLADLFTDTTVMFADIAGFSEWSSVREPAQMFTLLETIYRAFDTIAKKRKVFKVETVGDCYVAVCGLPDPRKDHAAVMARFARDCMYRMEELTRKLEILLGPGTGDLGLRVGLHSGPVTAGVLRGERSRFQLFGDTMNTASRMQSTGKGNRIQVSDETARLLIGCGKEHWLMPREQQVAAKGKGMMATFWLITKGGNLGQFADTESCANFSSLRGSTRSCSIGTESDRTSRLVDWLVEVLRNLLKQIMQQRKSIAKYNSPGDPAKYEAKLRRNSSSKMKTILDEVEDVIHLPRASADKMKDDVQVEIPTLVVNELALYVTEIAGLYRENPFHNIEHASHVAMSVVKLLSRIVAPSEVDYNDEAGGEKKGRLSLHDYTYGITSDPLTQFACVLSALIHDTDHPGVPNAQLVKEGHDLALLYKDKSVAEQNALEVAWTLFMEDRFKNLRAAIYASEVELKRFRQLLVNLIMATDVVDKDLKALRDVRWEKAFNEELVKRSRETAQDKLDRKATIVIEHLVQASDVAHTMQHWHVFCKWNKRFFMECYNAFRNGRADADPADTWYQGELLFFDTYVIPLAMKLKDCGVFGVFSDEYLTHAVRNRNQWELTGKEIVDSMVEVTKESLSENGQVII
ncbi:hypothetical protein ACA910_017813 [Epithemia clementina (nom. ined.)]